MAPEPLLRAPSLIFGKIQTVACNISLARDILFIASCQLNTQDQSGRLMREREGVARPEFGARSKPFGIDAAHLVRRSP